VLISGQVVIAMALAILGFGPANADYAVHLLVPLALLGLGGGLSFPSLTIIAMSDAKPSDAGLASGLLNTTGQVGGALGLAVLATIAGTQTSNLVRDGVGSAAALAGGYHLAWLIGAATICITLALTMSFLHTRTSLEANDELAEDEAVA
jgi:MFS family permease